MSWTLRAASSVALLVLACNDPPAPPPSYPVVQSSPALPAEPAAPLAKPGSPGCGKPAPKSGVQHVSALGRDRSFILVTPDSYAPDVPYPLVFVLHGGGGNAAAARTQTDLEKVAAGHAVFVYPDAAGGNWDLDAPTAQNGDVALFDAILLAEYNAFCIDSRRVFVTGFSNGGYMANQLGCKRGERIRGIVTHSAGGPYETSGTYDSSGNLVCPGKAVASLVVHGNSDRTVAPSEGQKSIDHWSFANRCGSVTSSAWVPPCVQLQGCFQPVGVCRIPGLGHGLWAQAGKATWAFIDGLR